MGRGLWVVLFLFLVLISNVSVSGQGDPLVTEQDFRIEEAKADVEYYAARIQSLETILKKVESKSRFEQTNFDRIKKLLPGKSISQEEYDAYEQERDQWLLNVDLIQSHLASARAELRAAQARVGIAQTATFNVALLSRFGKKRAGIEQHDAELEDALDWEFINSFNIREKK